MKNTILKKVLIMLIIISSFYLIFTGCSNAIEKPLENQELSNNANLSSLIITKDSKLLLLNPDFSKNIRAYAIDLTCDKIEETVKVQVMAQKEDEKSTLKVNNTV
ncbi:MAG TPA: hypothetical protein PK771_08925, partial [Spirochaetota bacterium]|nr:hypothetical protein [Spirochaetota bacterium]